MFSQLQDPTGDRIQACFQTSALLNLGMLLKEELVENHGTVLNKSAGTMEVTGKLSLAHDDFKTHKSARCRIKVTPDWSVQPPKVWCVESWVRHDWDWHAGDGGRLCYVIDEQWGDLVGSVFDQQGQLAAARYAVALCLRNVRWLLYRHYIASVMNIKVWPEDWKAWSHGDKGIREYLRERGR